MSGTPAADPGNANDPDHYVSTTSGGNPCLIIQGDSQANWCETFAPPPGTCGAMCAPGTPLSGRPQTISGYPGLIGTYDVYVTLHQELASTSSGNGCVTGVGCLSSAGSVPPEIRVTVAVLPGTKLVNGALQNLPSETGSRKPLWLSTIVTAATPGQAQ